ncbi:Uu.00g141640.m01.CDS01 [Anthostomella pinea]|uniref:Uu.00g141640.m01.CDS01 n=1 Tax=Anthostomella pinea TaxID=933095 RepID=A0AAI8YLD3_9PEZI|nr:Uu.00g141640.m01.CDS01 [Anthostomella pinea]
MAELLSQHKIYHEGAFHPPQGTLDKKNWTDLQVVLRCSIRNVTPTKLSLSEGKAADPAAAALTFELNVQQSWSRSPQPLTLCTSLTILTNRGRGGQYMNWQGEGPTKILPHTFGNARFTRCGRRERQNHSYVTVPPGDEGLTFQKGISWGSLLRPYGRPLPENVEPVIGDRYDLVFAKNERREPFTQWWNFGDLESDLKDKKLVHYMPRPDPAPVSSGEEDESPQFSPDSVVLPFKAWEDYRDEDRDTFVRLAVHFDTTPVEIVFVE